MAIEIYPKGSLERISEHFAAKEFDCPCSNCARTWIDDLLPKRLDAMREQAGSAILITSGYRCEKHQDELKAKGYETASGLSTHEMGKAADIRTGKHSGAELETLARNAGIRAVGIGKTWIHIDLRGPEMRRWFYVRR